MRIEYNVHLLERMCVFNETNTVWTVQQYDNRCVRAKKLHHIETIWGRRAFNTLLPHSKYHNDKCSNIFILQTFTFFRLILSSFSKSVVVGYAGALCWVCLHPFTNLSPFSIGLSQWFSFVCWLFFCQSASKKIVYCCVAKGVKQTLGCVLHTG